MESWFSVNLTYLSFIINMASVGYCIFTDNTDAALAGLLMNYAVNLSSDIISVTNNVAIFQAKVISLERIYSVTKIEPE
jgi:ABC-type multidrug transport system fused ATPase/permease subunit